MRHFTVRRSAAPLWGAIFEGVLVNQFQMSFLCVWKVNTTISPSSTWNSKRPLQSVATIIVTPREPMAQLRALQMGQVFFFAHSLPHRTEQKAHTVHFLPHSSCLFHWILLRFFHKKFTCTCSMFHWDTTSPLMTVGGTSHYLLNWTLWSHKHRQDSSDETTFEGRSTATEHAAVCRSMFPLRCWVSLRSTCCLERRGTRHSGRRERGDSGSSARCGKGHLKGRNLPPFYTSRNTSNEGIHL